MDLRRLSRALPRGSSPFNASNSTENLSLADLPPTILDAVIPGYSLISRYALAVFGIDISVFVSIAVVLLAVTKGGQYLFRRAEVLLRYFFISSVYIDEHDDLFDMVMAWLAKNQGPSSRRSVRAKTQRGNKAQAELDENYDAQVDDVLNETTGMFDFNKWSARMPPRFEPYYGRHRLRHNGHWFFIRRSQKTGDRMQIRFNNASQDDLIQIDCLGRSIKPIEGLLRSIKDWSLNRMRNTTTIRHPTPKDRGRFGGAWSKTTSRPSRPMDTVILDAEQKSGIIKDMNEYLHPASPRWYATRGIPYRRGYLFYGPPGTGKTSLSFALAGIFGLEIYAISLQEPSSTEGDLMQLFNALPRRCIVLLEDVDAAGLLRDGKSDDSNPKPKRKGGKRKGQSEEAEGEGSDAKKRSKKNGKTEAEPEGGSDVTKKPEKDEDYTLRDLARELKAIASPPARERGGAGRGGNNANSNSRPNDNGNNAQGGNATRQPGTGISLSGLLNAIDGVATHEGRVLIMTTNHPERLDSALVRPGRVDRRVEFRLAMKDQIRELFVRMYAATEETSISAKVSQAAAAATAIAAPTAVETKLNGHVHTNGHLNEKQANGNLKEKHLLEDGSLNPPQTATTNGVPKGEAQTTQPAAEESSVSRAELEDLAARFAEGIPDDTFTPAEIQNHLMRYKNEPRIALERAEAWMREVEEEKEKQRKASEEDDEDEDGESDDQSVGADD